MQVVDWIALVEALAPPELAESWDRVGLLLGRPDQPADRALIALSVTPDVVDQAVVAGAGLIIAHHPILFEPLTAIRTDTAAGETLRRLLAGEIAVYAAHTNLDNAPGGLNDWLAEALGLAVTGPLAAHAVGGGAGTGRVGRFEPALPWGALVSRVRQTLGLPKAGALRLVGEAPPMVTRAAVWGGSGQEAIALAHRAGAEVLVTGDLKYHAALAASELGLAVIDAGHFGTERPVLDRLAAYLRDRAEGGEVLCAKENDPFAAL